MPYAQERVQPYGKAGSKGVLVEEMFNNIAPTYDRLNHRLSLSIDYSWRRQAVKALAEHCPQTVLDIATGTGDIALLIAQTLHPQQIIGADISEKMMAIGAEKVRAAGLQDIITFAHEDCMALSFDDNTFDAVTSAFGIRNFEDLDLGLREICRVLRPGGVFVAIEATTPRTFPMKQLFTIYAKTIIPLYGQLIARDKGAYEYLTNSVAAFPQGEAMQKILTAAGFTDVSFHRMTGGICTRYIAIK